MKTRSPFEPLLFAGLILVGAAIGIFAFKWLRGTPIGEQTKLEQIIALVERQYVDSISTKEAEETAIQSFLTSFDPHSVYIPPKYVEMANQELKGGFDGIGVEFFMHNDTPYVVRVIERGPAEKAGLLPGDRLLMGDTVSLLGMQNNQIIETLKGSKNTEIKLKIYRTNLAEAKIFTVVRATIPQASVQSTMLNEETAYVKIKHFAEPTHKEFIEQFNLLNANNRVKQIVVDLRDNPGGYLKTAIELLDEFVDSKELLAYTKGKDKNRKSYYATPGGLCAKLDLICLVNEGSASASEIFSGAIQDLDRGIIIGRRTFGKGLVQETFQLNDGSQIRLTVARYYIPSGRSIQKAYDKEGYTKQDSSELAHKMDFKTTSGRIVKAEGGVSPDISMDNIVVTKTNISVAEISVNILDEMYRNNLVNVKDIPKTWLKDTAVHNLVLRNVKKGYPIARIEERLLYQIWGPIAVMEYYLTEDPWISRAMASFSQKDKLLNP